MFLWLRRAAILAVCVGMATQANADDSGLVSVRLGNAAPWLGNSATPSAPDAAKIAQLLGIPGSSWTASLPSWLRWALEPQVQVANGGATAGMVGQGYRGVTWSVPLANGVMHVDDALSFGFSLGQSLIDPTTGTDGVDRRTTSPTALLRFGAGIGYQVTPRMGVYVLFDHQSGSGPTRLEDTENDLGIRLGLRF